MHQKLRSAPVIYLVGFMGSGKSTVGRMLAARLGWPFVDLDEEIERCSGLPISKIFEREGEARFRDLEHQALLGQLQQARGGRARVLALGGGAFAEGRNRDSMGGDGVVIWLECSVETLWRRASAGSNRPLARQRDEFERLYRERLPRYQSADFTVSTETGGPASTLEQILALPLFA